MRRAAPSCTVVAEHMTHTTANWSLLFVTLLGSASGCAAKNAKLTGAWTFVADSGGAIQAPNPPAGMPYSHVESPCMTDTDLRERFGDTCPNHEPEAAATAAMTDDFGPGLNPTPGEVRWYCACPMVVRVVLQRCPNSDAFQPTQVAVATKGICE